MHVERNEAIRRIRSALKRRSKRRWSVTGNRGTAWGWIDVNVAPQARGEHESMPADARLELAELLGLDHVHFQGLSISPESRAWHVERFEAEPWTCFARPAWKGTTCHYQNRTIGDAPCAGCGAMKAASDARRAANDVDPPRGTDAPVRG